MKKLVLLQVMMIGLMVSCTFAGTHPDKEVQKAFELRINGKVDEAKALLENVLTKDSTNAMAHYEMARINYYLLTGGGGTSIDDILASVNKAVMYDPANVTYAYYKGIASFLNAFMAMQMGQDEVKKRIAETCVQFEKVLSLKPDYCEPMLYLVEIYGMLPPDMGGDSSKAVVYAEKLSEIDGYFGARAKAVLMPENTDLVKYWEVLIVLNGRKPAYLKEAGKACLFIDDAEKAEKYFEEAIRADRTNNLLILDLGRYHMMKVMQNKDLAAVELPVAKACIEKYLASTPEPIIPIKAYARGLLTKIEMFQGNQAEAEKLMEEAKALDKYFSRASGVPNLLLFDRPDQISHHYFSFFSPF